MGVKPRSDGGGHDRRAERVRERRDLRRRQPLRRVHLLKLVFSRLQLLLAGFTCGLELLLTGLELLLTSFKLDLCGHICRQRHHRALCRQHLELAAG